MACQARAPSDVSLGSKMPVNEFAHRGGRAAQQVDEGARAGLLRVVHGALGSRSLTPSRMGECELGRWRASFSHLPLLHARTMTSASRGTGT